MPQNTNLNVSPYFDDFSEDKNYKRVLFKPGTPIQARELTTLQSILQNQIDRFGQHFFKEGAKVIPGQTSYDNRVDYVLLDPIYFGVEVSSYVNNLIGINVVGQTSGLQAKIELAITNAESTAGKNTLYFKYANSSTTDFNTKKFSPGETLLVAEDVTYTGGVLKANSPFANVTAEDPVGKASIAGINDGVYFLRGHFVKVLSQKVILDQYSSFANARVGLLIEEDIVTSYDDDTLNDNAQGFSNYAAPGADRLKISTTFIKKDLDNLNDENFIELMRVVDGDLQSFTPSKANDTALQDALAKRTYDESGNYTVKPFSVSVKENLNDGLGNNGVYFDNQTTPSGLEPSEAALTVEISAGKAYVLGYDIEKLSTTLIDIDKPRTSRAVSNYSLSFGAAARTQIDNLFGTPRVGITTTDVIQLSNSRIDNSAPSTLPGTQIGVARLYDIYTPDSKYVDDQTKFECALFDIETFTSVTLSSKITLNAPAFIKGKNSGASGYLYSNVGVSSDLTLYGTRGKFLIGESVSVNGISSSPTVYSVRDFDFSDVKSIRSVDASTSQVFTADLVLNKVKSLGPAATQYSITAGGVVTVGITTASTIPPKIGDIISYTKSGNPYPSYNKVSAVATNLKTFTVVGISSVTGVYDGTLPAAAITVNDLKVLQPDLVNSEDRDLFESLPTTDISALDLTNSSLEIRKTYIANVSSSSFTVVESDPNLFFKPFNINEYQLSYTDGIIEPLTAGSVIVSNGGKTITITQLSKNTSSNAKLIATLNKINLTVKKKNLVKAATVTFNRSTQIGSGTGGNTLNDGLTYSSIYGTRVQDKEICLYQGDVLNVLDIYESYDENDPVLPTVIVNNIVGDLTTLLPGQVFNGMTSKAKAKLISSTSTTLTFAYINAGVFTKGETLDFINSDISANINTINQFSKDISDKYVFDNGSRSEYVDYAKIILKEGQQPPAKRVTVVFDYYSTPAGDTGDFTSFSSFDPALYSNSIPYIYGSLRATDAIDIRPRVTTYDPATATKSPFEFNSRVFSTTGASVTNPILNASQILLGYSYYLGRIDVLFLNKNGSFEISQGSPSESPQKPILASPALDIAVISMPAYVYDAKEVYVSPVQHKRYTMKDIERLEQRLSNVEQVTSLSFLESNTKNLNIKDAKTGLDRFKSGFFVDNFENHDSHSIAHPDFKASIDATNGILRPSHYTTCFDLDYATNVTDDGVNIKKSGSLITLDYTEKLLIEQKFATRIENVNPFSIVKWSGTLSLTPESDTWIDTKQLDAKNLTSSALYDAMNAEKGINPNTGLTEVDWGSWEEIWTGKELVDTKLVSKQAETLSVVTNYQVTETTKNKKGKTKTKKVNKPATDASAKATGKPLFKNVAVWEEEYELTYQSTSKFERKGVQFKVNEKSETQNLGSRVVSREIIPYMRARNIEFKAQRVKPSTQYYAFFNKINVTEFCFPKLIEIEMVSGTFSAGEDVESQGFNIGDQGTSGNNGKKIRFQLQSSAHKYDKPGGTIEFYEKNPYDLKLGMPSNYSSTSTLLNVDTDSLNNQKDSKYSGYLTKGMKLIGKTSGAQATIKDLRLISDEAGTLIGSFYIPDGNVNNNPKFTSGTKTFQLTSDEDNEPVPGEVISQVEANFTAAGTQDNVQETTLTTRIPYYENIPIAPQTKTVDNGKIIEVKEYSKTRDKNNVDYIKTKDGQIIPLNAGNYDATVAKVTALDQAAAATAAAAKAAVEDIKKKQAQDKKNAKVLSNELKKKQKEAAAALKFSKSIKPTKCGYGDPIAQTFKVPPTEESGIFVTSIEVYFQKKDSASLPVACQIRTCIAGSPTSKILPFGEATLLPKDITVSADASIPTKFILPAPLFLTANTEYAIVLQTDSSDYQVWISRMSEVDVSTKNKPEAQQIIVSQQPYLGSFFKSQNGETWDPSQLEDLKFKLNIAQFSTDGGVFATYNPVLDIGNKQIVTLKKDPIKTISRDSVIKLGNNISAVISPGVTITQMNNLNATGKLVSTKGAIAINNAAAMTTNNVGSGLTPSVGSFTYSNVPIISVTGIGTGAVGIMTVNNGNLDTFTITNGGSGYSVGDIVTAQFGQLNENTKFNVGIVSAFNTLELSDVQGQFDLSNEVVYISSGSTAAFSYSGTKPIPISVTLDPAVDGLHFKVDHRGHAMHSRSNKVIISNVQPDINPAEVTQENYSSTATTPIKVTSVGIFTSFENVAVSAANPGYVRIDSEIISYTGVDAAASPPTLTGIARGIDSSLISGHDIGDKVYKYELNGVSLRRINKTHNFSEANPLLQNGIDHYYLKIDTTSTGSGVVRDGSVANGFPILRFTKSSDVGGVDATATQNIQFETLTPNIEHKTPPQTKVSCRVRTITATSVSGNEVSFIDQGFQQMNLNQMNHFTEPRMVASQINETTYLTNLPKNKSLWTEIILQTENPSVSPIIDLDRVAMILTTNRLDAPVTDFITDNRINAPVGDPHAAVYVSNKVKLENPATSLDLRFAAQRQESAQIRALYKLFRPDSPDASQPYILFPGFAGNEDGTPDKNVTSENNDTSASDYKFSVDNLSPFTGFMIKIIMSGTNQAEPPLIADLSVIALA